MERDGEQRQGSGDEPEKETNEEAKRWSRRGVERDDEQRWSTWWRWNHGGEWSSTASRGGDWSGGDGITEKSGARRGEVE